ncbi:hypothetical protein QPK13_03060 [Photorhabdus tasmaniensis]
MCARVPMRGTGAEQAVVAMKDRNGFGAKGLPHCADGGAAGIDGQTLTGFDENVTDNLYKLWNRLASGSYIPPAVRRVEIPKVDGGVRPLGIPAVSDRIAQTVIKQVLEPVLEPLFHAIWLPAREIRTSGDCAGEKTLLAV